MDDGANDGDERAATSGVGAGALDLRQQIADMSASAIEQIEKLAAMAQLIADAEARAADAEARAADAEARAADYEARVGRWNELMRQVEAGIARIARMQEAQLSENKRIPGLIESCAAAEARAADAEARAADAEARAADAETRAADAGTRAADDETRAADAAKRTAQLNQFWKDTLRAQVDETLESWPTAQVDEMLKTSQARTFADNPSEHKLPPAPPRSPLRERND